MLYLLPLACASAIYPTLLAAVVLILGRPNPRRLLAVYLVGAMTTSIGLGLLIVFGLDTSDATSGSGNALGPTVDLAVGLTAVFLFWVLLTERDRAFRERRVQRRKARNGAEPTDNRDPWSQRILARGSLVLTFLLGIVLSLPGALYLVALKDIAEAEVGPARSVGLVVAYNLIMFALAEVPLAGYFVAPERTTKTVEHANAWLGGHGRDLAAWLCAGVGGLLIVRGVAEVVG